MSEYQYYEYRQPQSSGEDNKKKKDSFGKKIGKAVALGLVFGLVAGAGFQASSVVTEKLLGKTAEVPALTETVTETESTEKTEEQAAEAETATTLASATGELNSTAVSTAVTVTDVSDIVDNVMPAVVQVTAVSLTEYYNFFGQASMYESESAGSGIIASQDDDYIYIMTNNHVVSGATSLTVTFVDDTAVEAEVQGTVPNMDLAVVKVKISDIQTETMDTIKMATLGDSDSVIVGQSAVVIGNALGYGQSVTTGVISALDREVQFRGEDGNVFTNTLIQTDAAINPGNSGGALLDMNGAVIGIVSAKYSDTDVEGMGYAIPISNAKEAIISLIRDGRYEMADSSDAEDNAGNGGKQNTQEAYLGISGVDITKAYASAYGYPEGVYLAGVFENSGADMAGMKKGDIIVGMEGKTVTTMAGIQEALSDKKPGDTVTVTIYTASSEYENTKTVRVTLSSKDSIKK